MPVPHLVPQPGFFRARLSPQGYLGLHLTAGALILLVAVLAFFNIAADLVTDDPMVMLDLQVSRWFYQHATPGWTWFFRLVSGLHGTAGVLCLTALVALFLTRKRSWTWICLLALSVPLGMLLNVLLKNIFQRARPSFEHPLLTLATYSFPSGHVAAATLLYGVLGAYLLSRSQGGWRVLIVVSAFAMVVLVGLSRMYLGAHYLSDVVAAVASSTGWLAITFSAVATWKKRQTAQQPTDSSGKT